MKYSFSLNEELKESKRMVDLMIESAQRQGIKNFEMLYTLQKAIDYLILQVNKNRALDDWFLPKWDSIMGWIPKVLEATPLLDILRKIDRNIYPLRGA